MKRNILVAMTSTSVLLGATCASRRAPDEVGRSGQRLKDLTANAKGANEKAKAEVKAQLAALESRAKEQHARVQSAEEETRRLGSKRRRRRPVKKSRLGKRNAMSRNSPVMLTALSNTQ
jgi:hypothetical protein